MTVQALQARELMAADFAWDGDVLQVSGSESDDFISVQTSDLGTQVVTDDTFISEVDGRSIDSASSIEVFGGGGNDRLLSYRSPVPVSLLGGSGNDFLYSDTASDVIEGGEGNDWAFSETVEGTLQDAFGLEGFDLDPSSLTGTPTINENNVVQLKVDVEGETEIAGTAVDLEGIVEIGREGIDVELAGTVPTWEDAFGIPELDLEDTRLTIGAGHDFEAGNGYRIGLESTLNADGVEVGIEGSVEMQEDLVTAEFTGTVDQWDDAFGIQGLDLEDARLTGTGVVAGGQSTELELDIEADLIIDSVEVDVEGNVTVAPNRIEGSFTAAVENWEDAFGIDGLSLNESELSIEAYSDRADDYGVHIDVLSSMEIEGKEISVSGDIEIVPERIDATLRGSVDAWDDAFGMEGLMLNETELEIIASSDRAELSDFQVNLSGEVDISGTSVAVDGTVTVDDEGYEGALVGTVGGEWASALGVVGLNLHDTTLSVRAAKSETESEFEVGVSAGMDLWGTSISIGGHIEVLPGGTSASLTGSVEGDWEGAFGIDALTLRDTSLAIATNPDHEFSVSVDTGVQLFGNYIDVAGTVTLGDDGPSISFTPPETIGFVDLLGIPGFTLDDADLEINAGADGIEVAIDTVMDFGEIGVDLKGAIAVGKDQVTASLTGQVDRWENAFDVAGLNLDDIVLTLGAESGAAGASMYIGLGAGLQIGSKEIDVAGLVGFGTKGWEVAFRGEIDSLSSEDLIGFANTITMAGDPSAVAIPDDALGAFEIQDAYINFAPYGGNEDLGIADGFGIGGEFYEDGELLAEGEFQVDLDQLFFQVTLEIPELDLGPVDLSDVVIDIRIASGDSYYKVAGTAELMGSEVSVAGEINGDGSFLVMGTADIRLEGMAATATFTIDNSGVSFEAAVQGSMVNDIKGSVADDLLSVTGDAQVAIDQAQAGVEAAMAGVAVLEDDLADARAEAQDAINEIKADIASAKSVVDSLASSRNYWNRVKSSRYRSWRSAVSATRRAVWYKKPYYKGIEASRYASYAAAAGTYSSRVVAHRGALATYNGVKAAAGWALDTAGVEANPEVIRLRALLTTAKAALQAAEGVLNAAEEFNADAMRVLNIADSLQVDRIMLSGKIEASGSVSFTAEVDYSFAGNRYSFAMEADSDKLVEQLAGRLVTELL